MTSCSSPTIDPATFSGAPVQGFQFGQVLNPHSMLDARLVSKPQVFSGREDDWPIWSLSMRSFAGGIHPQMLLLMQEAEARKDQEIPESEVGPTQKVLDNQLYYVLQQLCTNKKTYDMISNVGY